MHEKCIYYYKRSLSFHQAVTKRWDFCADFTLPQHVCVCRHALFLCAMYIQVHLQQMATTVVLSLLPSDTKCMRMCKSFIAHAQNVAGRFSPVFIIWITDKKSNCCSYYWCGMRHFHCCDLLLDRVDWRGWPRWPGRVTSWCLAMLRAFSACGTSRPKFPGQLTTMIVSPLHSCGVGVGDRKWGNKGVVDARLLSSAPKP